jgi:hypothetical protein
MRFESRDTPQFSSTAPQLQHVPHSTRRPRLRIDLHLSSTGSISLQKILSEEAIKLKHRLLPDGALWLSK